LARLPTSGRLRRIKRFIIRGIPLKKILIALLIGIGIYSYFYRSPTPGPPTDHETAIGDHILAVAYQNQQSGVQVAGAGEVIQILPDDNQGRRHQKFILQLPSGQTILVAHNIDLAPRIGSLQIGDRVEFNGQYEWNAKGGVVHWTHHDPDGSHADGWLRHAGRVYQ
jgi:hypothetical protein